MISGCTTPFHTFVFALCVRDESVSCLLLRTCSGCKDDYSAGLFVRAGNRSRRSGKDANCHCLIHYLVRLRLYPTCILINAYHFSSVLHHQNTDPPIINVTRNDARDRSLSTSAFPPLVPRSDHRIDHCPLPPYGLMSPTTRNGRALACRCWLPYRRRPQGGERHP